LTIEGRPHAPGEQIDGSYRVVTPGYLRAMRIELVAGQDFTARDREGAPRKAIVNQRLASLAWRGENPLGKRFSDVGGGEDEQAWLEVVGVAADVRSGNLGSDSRPEFYVPLRQTPGYVWDQTGGASLSLVVRARRDPAALADALRRAVAKVDADLPVYDLMTMDDIRRSAVAPSRFNSLLLTAQGLVGLALALVGIFGVVSYFVTQRTQEIGLRMALGATRGKVLRLVLGQALKPVIAGLVLGLAGAALVGRSLAGWLYGIEPAEVGTFAVLGALLATAALLAAYAPARRATGVDPSRALAP
jgi:predicted permease